MAVDVEALREVGYVVVAGALGPHEVEELRAAFPPPTPGSTLHVEIDEHTPHLERWHSLHRHPLVGPLLDQMLGRYEVRLHGRDPGHDAGAQGLHADRPGGGPGQCEAITLLWMLDPFMAGSGATRVVPRSHRGRAAVPRSLAQPGTTHPDEVVITGHPGDLLLFDAHLWHSGRHNTSGARRRAVQMTATRTRGGT